MQSSKKFLQHSPRAIISIVGSEAKMIGPIERTILQCVGNVLFDTGWEITDVSIRKPRIFELADIETEPFDHRLEASNSQLQVRVVEVHLIGAVVADKEIGD